MIIAWFEGRTLLLFLSQRNDNLSEHKNAVGFPYTHAAPTAAGRLTWDTPASRYQILGNLLCHVVTLGRTRGWCLAWHGRNRLGSGAAHAAGLRAAFGGRRDAELHESVIANVGLW